MESKSILVTGGAGYIGAHTTQILLQRGFDVTVVDDLSRGHAHNVEKSRLYRVNLLDTNALTRVLQEKPFDAVIHFAAYIAVGESMNAPELYFTNNTCGSLSLLAAMVHANVKRLVFSSTAAVYGIPATCPITEDFPIAPVSPYGESKVMVERMLRWFDQIHGLTSISLRYFNACGADPDGALGEEHEPETHLIPLVLRAVLTGNPITIYGGDYPTPDGTCIRDYVHVADLAEAHVSAVRALCDGSPSGTFNVGTGQGHSVREVIRAAEEVTGKPVPFTVGPRRPGDPPALVAGSDKLRRMLDWQPRYTGLREIVRTAWEFERTRHAEKVK